MRAGPEKETEVEKEGRKEKGNSSESRVSGVGNYLHGVSTGCRYEVTQV